MIKLGEINILKASRVTPHGVYLSDDENNEVKKKKKYIADNLRLNDAINVFIYKDSKDRITATTRVPKIKLGEFAYLQVVDVAPFGAFLDWGLEKDLLVPFKEQSASMIKGKWYAVCLYHDQKSDRLVASTRLNRFLEKEQIDLKKDEQVSLLVLDQFEQGINVIINNRYKGLIFKTDLFKKLSPGEETTGFIKNIRPDKKIDVVLRKPGYGGIEPNAQKILNKIKSNNGYLALCDSSDPEEIKAMLGMSKKTFKKAVGLLYKKKHITIEQKGIRLNEPH